MSKLKILVVDDFPIFRVGLGALFSKIADLEIIGEAENGQLAIEQARQLKPHLILMDLMMPVMGGTEAIRIIKKHQPEIKIIALTGESQLKHIQETLAAGADGYVLKDDSNLTLLTAINAVKSGQTYLSPGICNTVLGDTTGDSEHIRSAISWCRLNEQEQKEITHIPED
jgi:DNA-binding NarL/FixJ family response regulator